MKRIFLGLYLLLSIPYVGAAQSVQSAWEQSYTAEAAGDYTKAVQILTKSGDKGYMTLLRLGYLSHLAGQHIESMRYYQLCINLMPYAIEPRLGYVNPAAAVNNWSDVRKQYEEILKIDPKQTLVLYRMGLIHYNLGEYPKALGYFEKVANLYPADYDTLLMYAWTQLQLGKKNEAKVLFEKVLLLSPSDASALQGLGLIR
jgi:tetratricopeptide (TPR) repeat protein